LDPLTHGLASYALRRAFFPRLPRSATPFVIAAGVVADLDWISYSSGPSAFLTWHRTYTHSILLATLASLLIGAVALVILRRRGAAEARIAILFAPLIAGVLHVAMDACQSDGVSLLWPFRENRFVLDWLPNFDPWILAILLLAILLPELFLLVGTEIGARTRRPRGRNGAIAGLVVLVLYVGLRATLHANAVATLRSPVYSGESPRRIAAFPEAASLLTWRGIVETPSALHVADVSAAPGAFFSSDTATTIYKPADSPFLEAARDTSAARLFLKFARFPKATVEHETAGYSVEIRDLRYAAMRQTFGAIEVNVNLDTSGRVTFQELEWQKNLSRK
jgi:membrane-bound metal-dependent hydrolase YbcI (DUF457 family)